MQGLVKVNTASGDALASSAMVTDNVSVNSFACKASNVSKQFITDLLPNSIVECCTAGKFSLHDLVADLLAKVGPSKVYLTSWTFKEAPARLFLQLKEQKLITELHGVFDYRCRTMDAKIYPFMQTVFDSITLTKMHAKCCVIENDTMSIAIVSTANFANNNRCELVILNTTKPSVKFHLEWIQKIINGSKIY
jgi:hypothetical protein